ncbi:MAG TPA: ABC transporter permease [Gammaproteobacteria bacterium]|nr:ABC transporter permease [Gammaproteobacteria bacterium]
MMGLLGVIIAKDLRLLLRDRAALVFLTIAPIVVMSVAGFSLAPLYGADAGGRVTYELPIVDEDGGDLATQIENALRGDETLSVRRVSSRAEAQQLVRDKAAGSALVIPTGTRDALAAGRPARLLLYTDPVRFLDRINMTLRVAKARDALADAERARIVKELADQRAQARAQLEGLDASLQRVRANLEAMRREAGAERARAAGALDTELDRLQAEVSGELDARIKDLAAQVNAAVAERVGALQEPARAYLDELMAARRELEAWFAELQRLAARRADRIPDPPAFPEPPPELTRAIEEPPAPIELPVNVELRILPRLRAALDALDGLAVGEVDVQVPDLELPEAVIPAASLGVEEISIDGGPTEINPFDQNVPGFSVTFMLLGMLFAVALGLFDERDLRTFDRVRALPVPVRNIVLGKLASRFAVGVVQMLVLFAVGFALFRVSLGPQPWALLLPILGIVFVGTAIGLVAAAVAPSRDAVVPLGAIVILTMAAVGGCWWPIDLEPEWMHRVALAFPTTWAMDAFNDLMLRGRRVEAVYPSIAALFAHGAAYLTVGLVLFRLRYSKA